MPLFIDRGCIPPRWAERNALDPARVVTRREPGEECVRIAFVNNMPDPALEDTEMQFFELLDQASEQILVRISLYSLAGVPRGERAQEHLNRFYFGADDLLNRRFDALIMTGTEPRQPDLRHEPYWAALGGVLDWAETNTVSTILSCLAAHAGVLHSDGLQRHPLGNKHFGVFKFDKATGHRLTAGPSKFCFPHSRWNEVQAEALASCAYTVLTQSSEGGVDTFVKKKKRSLFIHFQGHPEYSTRTLLKEYRRDIKRFLKQERDTYPLMPSNYFDADAARLLNHFQEKAVADRREECMEAFPEATLSGSLRNTWRSSALAIYRNWLQYVISRRTEASARHAVAVAYHQASQKGSVLS
jgi:homoserine O-succinyltransferase/O-acetyltransferase